MLVQVIVKVTRGLVHVDFLVWGGGRVRVYDRGVVLRERDGEERLPVLDCVHAHAIEKLGGQFHLDVSQEDQRVRRKLAHDDVHDGDQRRNAGLDADPRDVRAGEFALQVRHESFGHAEYVVGCHAARLRGRVDEDDHERGLVVRLQAHFGVGVEEKPHLVAIFDDDR